MSDVIQQLRELRQSSQSSVVTGIEASRSDQRPSIVHPVESWLIDQILDQLTRPGGLTISLIVLSGNAGDGKSHIIREIRQRLVEHEGLDPGMVTWLLDATESSHQAQRSVDRLDTFFHGFRDAAIWNPDKLHVVAMNTGTIVRFIVHDHERAEFRTLTDILSVQLGIKTAPDMEGPAYWDRFDRILVVDLDRRGLIPLTDRDDSFLDEMLGSLDRGRQGGFLSSVSSECSTCRFSAQCPVNTNLIAIQDRIVRQRLNTLLRDITLEDRVHIGPRGLWHLVYQMTVGGLDSAAIKAGIALPTCADIGGIDDVSRASALFFTALFGGSRDGADIGAAALSNELLRVDPARRFTLTSHEHALAAGLSAEEDLRLSRPFAQRLGVSAEALSDPGDDSASRSSAAVRRAFFLDTADPDPTRHSWLSAWAADLDSHKQDVLQGRPTRYAGVSLLTDVLTEIYGYSDHPGLWHLKLPWRNLAPVYTELSLRPGRREAAVDARVVGPDTYRRGGVRPLAHDLAQRLGAYPVAITVPLRNGPDVRVTWPLFRLLKRVNAGGYIAASLDPERVQNLERIGANVGAQAAISEGVVVMQGDRGVVCEDDGSGGFDVVDL